MHALRPSDHALSAEAMTAHGDARPEHLGWSLSVAASLLLHVGLLALVLPLAETETIGGAGPALTVTGAVEVELLPPAQEAPLEEEHSRHLEEATGAPTTPSPELDTSDLTESASAPVPVEDAQPPEAAEPAEENPTFPAISLG